MHQVKIEAAVAITREAIPRLSTMALCSLSTMQHCSIGTGLCACGRREDASTTGNGLAS